MNKLRDMFNQDSSGTIAFINKIKLEMLQDHHCMYCIHATERPHVAYGEDGTDIFCPIFNELKLNYDDGMQCIFWGENAEKTEKFKQEMKYLNG